MSRPGRRCLRMYHHLQNQADQLLDEPPTSSSSPPLPFSNESPHDVEFSCRICLEAGTRNDFIAPCQCRGGSKWVHRDCLNRWRSTREDRAFSKCTECLAQYKLVCLVENDTNYAKLKRRLRFIMYVTRDVGLALLFTQVLVVSMALLFYLFDGKRACLEAMHMEGHVRTFYYLGGLFLFLATVGMFSAISMCMKQMGVTQTPCSHCQCNCPPCYFCCDDVFFYNPYLYVPVSSSADATPCCCCCGNCGECGGAGGAHS